MITVAVNILRGVTRFHVRFLDAFFVCSDRELKVVVVENFTYI